jgi:flagellar M-ring protein FliF
MAELDTSAPQTPPAVNPFTGFMAQPAVRKSLPALAGLAAIGGVGALYLMLASEPQRMLYSTLTDAERAHVVATLDSGAIGYTIDNATGAITVAEDDLYRARMLVAGNEALAAPETSEDMLGAIPLGASRTLEGERLKLARERELVRTIGEIDGIESVRVHLAAPERSVFVREKTAPSASVMVRLARGRSLDPAQVDAIVNLVAGSVPGMASKDVRVVDQNGALLSDPADGSGEALERQRAYEAKLREQIAQLLVPLLGEGNFSSEVQVELVQEESTKARESYDKQGIVQAESESRSVRSAPGEAGGVPGVLANTPPPPAVLAEEAPQGGAPGVTGQASDSQSSASRNYALGREVEVTSSAPGGLARISVAVAVSTAALKKIAPANEAKLQALVSAAVGAQAQRGDTVTVMTGKFEPVVAEELPFYQADWFAMALRYGGALLALLLVLLLGVRPLLAILRGDKAGETAPEDEAEETDEEAGPASAAQLAPPANLPEQVALARRLAAEQPDRAVTALQRMLVAKPGEA